MDKINDSSLPLQGLRILDLGTFIAAPYAATILGEFGAEVIKIEKPGAGDPLREFGTPTESDDSLCWLSEARNKRSLTLDIRKPAGAELLMSLVKTSDIVCESFRPGTMEKWGLGFEQLKKANPDIVMLRVSAFGQTGPLSEQIGFARIAHAFGGLAHLTGMPGGPPLTPGSTSLADYISGLYGAIGLLIALLARDKVGGQYIDLALYESIFRILDDLAPSYSSNGTIRGRLGVGTNNACPHGHFQCKDNKWVALACSSDKIFERLAVLMEQPQLADPKTYGHSQQRIADSSIIDKVVSDWILQFDSDELVKICRAADVPCALINTIEDIFDDEHISARENLVAIDDPRVENLVVPNVIPKLSATPGRVRHAGPELGDSTAAILGNLLGLDDDEIEQLRQDEVI